MGVNEFHRLKTVGKRKYCILKNKNGCTVMSLHFLYLQFLKFTMAPEEEMMCIFDDN